MHKKYRKPYKRDVFLAYLTDGAKRTSFDEYPIIENWMIEKEIPSHIIQWDRKNDVNDYSNTCICFYCNDEKLNGVLGNPIKYVDELKKYKCIVGMDASPYDNMPLWSQKSQIGLNLAITYYFGSLGIKVIPNVRLGDDRTFSSLEAYPKGTLIAIGTNGFVKNNENRYFFANQLVKVVDTLEPSGIVVYGYDNYEIFAYPRLKGIPIYQYDSWTMKRNASIKNKTERNDTNER